MNDRDRIRQFNSEESGVEKVDDKVEFARDLLEEALELNPPPDVRSDIQGIVYQLGDIRTKINKKRPNFIQKKAGAKLNVKTQGQDRYENRPGE